MSYPLRTRFAKDIVAEVLFPPKQTGKVLILLTGAPSMPSKPDVMNFFASKGYVCILPRLRGTWESGGEFLKNCPSKDILDIIDEITSKNFKGITTLEEPQDKKLHKVSVKNIYVIGGSFGGTGALLASSHPKVKKVVALAPVIDWSVDSPSEPFEFFQKFTEYAFGGAYRGKISNWKKMQTNKIYSPLASSSTLRGDKILILHAEDDDVVPIDPVYSFIRDTNAELREYKKGGHLGLNDTRKAKYYKVIDNFLR
jgi:dipeptidyl aminopeptidase/acylaminoacyl peptidase